jgi:hypothetical protein
MTTGYTPTLLAAELKALRGLAPGHKAWGFYQPGPWTGGASLLVDDEAWAVRICRTPLAVCEVLAEPPAGPGVVILSAVEGHALPDDVRGRLARRKLHRPSPWDALLASFRATRVAPMLRPKEWLAEALLAVAPPDGFPPAPAELIDPDTAWEQLLVRRFGLPDGRPDAVSWLVACADPAAASRFTQLPDALRDGLVERAQACGGALGAGLAQGMVAGQGARLLAAGLLGEVLYAESTSHAPPIVRAQALLEATLVVGKMPGQRGLQWFEAARQALGKLPGPQRQAVLAQAEAMLREHDLQAHAAGSSLLPHGLTQRLAALGRTLTSVLERQASVAELEAAYERVAAHALASAQPERLRRLRMAVRLARHLAPPQPAPAAGLAEALQAFEADGGWVDRARRCVFEGESQPKLAEPFERLLALVAGRRQVLDRRFAELLASWNEAPSASAGFLPIEGVLEHVVGPLAATQPVLLLVLDGMSMGVFEELTGSLADQGWALLRPASPRPVLSMVPSVTEFARTSLLAGKAMRGGQADEKKAFGAHPALRPSSALPAPVLFHKGELTEGGGGQLATAVREALGNARLKVVGVVVNAIDDHLGKTEQVLATWGVERIKPLEALLWEARQAKRVVIVTSDHGHVAEAGSQLVPGGTNDRYRAADGPPPGEHERLVTGPRVQAVCGAPGVVVPTTEAIRYTGKKNGYHGGATLAEMAVPLGVFLPVEQLTEGAAPLEAAGWTPAPPREPAWWSPAVHVPPPPGAALAPAPAVLPEAHTQMGPLFTAPVVAAPPPKTTSWLDALLASPTFEAQRAHLGPRAPQAEVVQRFLSLLDGNGGRVSKRAVATTLGMPEVRLPGLLSTLQRMLNLDGYAVVAVDDTAQEVRLDRELLVRQFELPT